MNITLILEVYPKELYPSLNEIALSLWQILTSAHLMSNSTKIHDIECSIYFF